MQNGQGPENVLQVQGNYDNGWQKGCTISQISLLGSEKDCNCGAAKTKVDKNMLKSKVGEDVTDPF